MKKNGRDIKRLLLSNRALLSAIPLPVFYKDRAGRYIGCSNAFTEVMGVTEDEISGKTVMELWPSELAEVYHNKDLDLMNAPQKQIYEFKVKDKNGVIHPVIYAKDVFRDENGQVAGIIGAFQDISDLKDMEASLRKSEEKYRLLNEELEQRVIDRTRQLETANADLRQITTELEGAYGDLQSAQSRILHQEKMASIGQLAAGVAHEINNPMGFIISNLSSLQRYVSRMTEFIASQAEALSLLEVKCGQETAAIINGLKKLKESMKLDYIIEDITGLIKESREGADRVKKIVQDLKSFAHIDESETNIADINAGLDSTINMVWNELKYNASVFRDYGDIPLIKCYPGQLNQVFMNILLNAAQSIEKNGEIKIRTWCDEKNIYVSISDNGCGIPSDKMSRIFEPFFTTKDAGKGTGLGLSISYDIVKNHQGSIEIKSEPGKGTTFTVILPIVTG